jgi:large subunit ribosomal protein L40
MPSATVFAATARSSRLSSLPLRVGQASVRYSGRREVSAADPKKEILRRALYPANIRNTPSPTGTWRPDVAHALQRAIPSVQAHDTIERAWKLHQRHLRKQREAERARKFECMRHAMEVLEELDPALFRAANQAADPRARTITEQELSKTLKGAEKRAMEARIHGLFPRDFRAPTDTAPRDGWKYDWTPVARPSATCEYDNCGIALC